jgi:hypothetical protein
MPAQHLARDHAGRETAEQQVEAQFEREQGECEDEHDDPSDRQL